MARLLGLLMGGAQGKSIDVATTALAEDGDDVLAEHFPDPLSGRAREICAGELAGVRDDDGVGSVLEEDGEGFAGPGAVSHEDVDPRNGRTLAVDPHEDVPVAGIDEAPVEADLDPGPAGAQGDRLGPLPGPRDDCDDGVEGAVVPL